MSLNLVRITVAAEQADQAGDLDDAVTESVLAELRKTPAIRADLDRVSDLLDDRRLDDAGALLADLRRRGADEADVLFYGTLLERLRGGVPVSTGKDKTWSRLAWLERYALSVDIHVNQHRDHYVTDLAEELRDGFFASPGDFEIEDIKACVKAGSAVIIFVSPFTPVSHLKVLAPTIGEAIDEAFEAVLDDVVRRGREFDFPTAAITEGEALR